MELASIDYQTLSRAIAYSNVFALLALGLNLTYITTKIPSFAHGDLATIGAYVSYFMLLFLLPSGSNVYITMPFAAAVSSAAALMMYLAVFRPMIRRGAGITPLMIASFGVHFVAFSLIAMVVDYVQKALKQTTRNITLLPYDFKWSIDIPNIISLKLDDYASLALNSTIMTIFISLLLYLLLNKTRFGIVMRASVDNLYLARAIGINVERIYAIAWIIIGIVTGIAGIYAAMLYPMTEELGWLRLASVFVASVVGGLGSIYGGLIGGYVVGLSTVLGEAVILRSIGAPSEYQLAIPFTVVIFVLLFAPQGIVGILRRR